MREIKTLIQQLRNYPNNLFVYPEIITAGEYGEAIPTTKAGLKVIDIHGQEEGFIELGTNDGKVIID